MSKSFSWREAVRGDRQILQGFTCTTPPQRARSGRPLPHPKPWEYQVQSAIRECKPPVGPDELLLLGEDDDGLGAVVWIWFPSDQRDLAKILLLAVGSEYRGLDHRHADEALETGLGRIEDRVYGSGQTAVSVIGFVHRKNVASQRMCLRAGFRLVGDVDASLQEWEQRIEPLDLTQP